MPRIINKLEAEIDFDYSIAVYHSLTALLDSNLVNSVRDELKQYNKRWDELKQYNKRWDDLPQNQKAAEANGEDLAAVLSDLLHDPDLPEPIAEGLKEG